MPLALDGPFALPLALIGGEIDRAGHRRTDHAWLASAAADPSTLVVQVAAGRYSSWQSPEHLMAQHREGDWTSWYFLGLDRRGAARFAAPAQVAPESWNSLRDNAGRLDAEDGTLLAAAVALSNWHTTHTHCPRCGSATTAQHAGWTRHCEQDGSEHYPRTDPAVIMAVVDHQDRLLLGNGAAWPDNRFSTLAGFVEPGETFEDAVRREVLEEVDIPVGQVTYLASQPWPFPQSVMIGFVAEALDTTITVDLDEVTAARWFTREELDRQVRDGTVVCPPSSSISRRLIEHWFGAPLPDDSVDRT